MIVLGQFYENSRRLFEHRLKVHRRFNPYLPPGSIAALAEHWFKEFKPIQSFSLELPSKVIRIKSLAFQDSALQSLLIPRDVKVLGSSCFGDCKSLSSISFESNS
jgi:hypothetical protein